MLLFDAAAPEFPIIPPCNRAFELITYKAIKDVPLPESNWVGVKMELWARLMKFGRLEEAAEM